MKESGAAVMQEKEKVKKLWKLVTILGAVLIGCIVFVCLYHTVLRKNQSPISAQTDFLNEILPKELMLPENACMSIRELGRSDNPDSVYDVPVFSFDGGKFRAVVDGYCHPRREEDWLPPDALTLSDGSRFWHSDWRYEYEKAYEELSSAAEEGMEYYSYLIYEKNSAYMVLFIHCNQPENTERLKEMYSGVFAYINENVKVYDGRI